MGKLLSRNLDHCYVVLGVRTEPVPWTQGLENSHMRRLIRQRVSELSSELRLQDRVNVC